MNYKDYVNKYCAVRVHIKTRKVIKFDVEAKSRAEFIDKIIKWNTLWYKSHMYKTWEYYQTQSIQE